MPRIEADEPRVLRWQQDLSASTPTKWWLTERANDNAHLGFVGIGPSRDPADSSVGELNTIAVRPEAWHLGVGKMLMQVALEGLRSCGYQKAVLWTLNDYPLGERFYVATGWRRTTFTRANGNQVRYDFELS